MKATGQQLFVAGKQAESRAAQRQRLRSTEGEASTAPLNGASSRKNLEEQKRPPRKKACAAHTTAARESNSNSSPTSLLCPLCFTFHSIPSYPILQLLPCSLRPPASTLPCPAPAAGRGRRRGSPPPPRPRRMSDRELRPLRSISMFQTPIIPCVFLSSAKNRLLSLWWRSVIESGRMIPCSFW